MIQLRIQPQDDFLLFRLEGLVFPEAWQDVLDRLQESTKDAPGGRLVGDLSGLVGWLGEPERRAVGVLLATRLAGMKKVALVIEAQKITGVVEEEAQRGGLDLRLFSSYDDAVRWAVS